MRKTLDLFLKMNRFRVNSQISVGAVRLGAAAGLSLCTLPAFVQVLLKPGSWAPEFQPLSKDPTLWNWDWKSINCPEKAKRMQNAIEV